MTKKIITKKEVEKVAGLARINMSEKEKEKFAQDIDNILNHFKDLEQVQTNGVEKFDHYEQEENQLRDDKMKQESEGEKEAIRKLFPERKGNQLKVKAVL